MQPLISIVIPVYNMEKYLDECMNTVLKQTYENLDIVLVDDGSKDGSVLMCDAYAKQDDRVQVIHKENGGLMSAWMEGVRHAKGEYLAFVDSDDWVELSMIEELAGKLTGTQREIICSNYIVEKKDRSRKETQSLPAGVYTREYIENTLYDELLGKEVRRIHCSRCMKLISRELIVNNMPYCNPKITMGEDLNIMFPTFLDAHRIVIVEGGYYYHYRLVEESMAHKYDARLFEKVSLLYTTLKAIIESKLENDGRKESFLTALKKEYIFLLFYVLKNELRGPYQGCIRRIGQLVSRAKEEEQLDKITLEVNSKAGKLLYFIWKKPDSFRVLTGRIAIGIFDRL